MGITRWFHIPSEVHRFLLGTMVICKLLKVLNALMVVNARSMEPDAHDRGWPRLRSRVVISANRLVHATRHIPSP